jgi:hypothetical protein
VKKGADQEAQEKNQKKGTDRSVHCRHTSDG